MYLSSLTDTHSYMKQLERDSAIRERDNAICEKDAAIMDKDTAIVGWNNLKKSTKELYTQVRYVFFHSP